jgi:predicted nucleotidyltransferase
VSKRLLFIVAETALDDRIARLLEGFPDVTTAWLFGSEARGEARAESDVDLALLLRDRSQTALDVLPILGRLAAELEQVAPGRRIDLVLLQTQGPVFQHRVLSEGRLVYDRDPRARVDFESDACVRYFDFLPKHQLAERHALAGFHTWFRTHQ